jgi:hypothetical protein
MIYPFGHPTIKQTLHEVATRPHINPGRQNDRRVLDAEFSEASPFKGGNRNEGFDFGARFSVMNQEFASDQTSCAVCDKMHAWKMIPFMHVGDFLR